MIFAINYFNYITPKPILGCLIAAGTIHVIASPVRSKIEKVAAGAILIGSAFYTYLHWISTLKTPPTTRTSFQEDQNLIELWKRIPSNSKPVFQGSVTEQAGKIRRWMSNNIGPLQDTHTLDLSELGMTSLPPEIGYFTALTSLNLKGNSLQSLPAAIGNLTALTSLRLEDNRLQTLPDSLFTLSQNCRISAERNRFSAQDAYSFVQRLMQHCIAHPEQGPHVRLSIHDAGSPKRTLTLEEELQQWAREFAQKSDQTDFQPLLSLGSQEQFVLSDYLQALRRIKDYKEGTENSKKNVLSRVERMVQMACTEEAFQTAMLAAIHEGLGACGDRVLIIFNDIEILCHLYRKDLSEQEFRALAIRTSRYEWLKRHAKQLAQEKGLGDEIQTILYSHIRLKDALDLPITSEGMLYPGVSGVTDEILDDACKAVKGLSEKQLLAQSDPWKEYIQTHYKKRMEEIREYYTGLLNEAAEYYDYKKENERVDFLEGHLALDSILMEEPKPQNYLVACQRISQLRDEALVDPSADYR